jgi:hypothetical protein
VFSWPPPQLLFFLASVFLEKLSARSVAWLGMSPSLASLFPCLDFSGKAYCVEGGVVSCCFLVGFLKKLAARCVVWLLVRLLLGYFFSLFRVTKKAYCLECATVGCLPYQLPWFLILVF